MEGILFLASSFYFLFSVGVEGVSDRFCTWKIVTFQFLFFFLFFSLSAAVAACCT